MNDKNEMVRMDSALEDFRLARRKAILTDILARLKGESSSLLSFEETRQVLRVQISGRNVIKDIPLDAIVGSVNRYEDFTQGFLPRSSIDPVRWAGVQNAQLSMTGLSPIEVYQIGEIYFVLDGNHRVSVARQMGMKSIQAYVTVIPTRVPITPDMKPDDLILKAEQIDFLDGTHLDQTRPEAVLEVSVPGQYPILLEHIQSHQQVLNGEKHRDLTLEEAATHWFDTIYLPIIRIARSQGLLRDFPGRSETDLYLWLLEKHTALEKDLGEKIEIQSATSQIAKVFGPSFRRVLNRWAGKIVGIIVPDTLDPGPEPGQWRTEVLEQRKDDRLFNDILIPISGSENSWKALDQAYIISQKEGSRLHGLHISRPGDPKAESRINQFKEDFLTHCKQLGMESQLAFASGDPARRISERAAWNDLVVINLSYPPKPSPSDKIRSGFRSLVLRCPRPILAVPYQISPLTRALLAYDASPKSQEALYIATYLVEKCSISLVVLTIKEGKTPVSQTQSKAREYLDAHHVQATYETTQGSIASSILVVAEDTQCDWIIMGGYGAAPMISMLADNVVDQVLRSSGRPLLLCR